MASAGAPVPAPVPSSPASAASLLRRLSELHTRPHMHSSRTRRASVAIILRVRPDRDSPFVPLRPIKKAKVKKTRVTKKVSTAASPNAGDAPSEADVMTRSVPVVSSAASASLRAAIDRLAAAPWVQSAQLEMLYMQRAQNPRDRWSGQMAFPGGRQERGETDEQTVVREVREEIGWDLDDSSHFVRLGQLDDKPMDGLKNVKPLAVAVFVFLQVCRTSPPLQLEPSEASAVLFTPILYFRSLRSIYDFGRIYHPLMLQILSPRAPSAGTFAPAAPDSAAASSSSPNATGSFNLKLIGWPHKRDGVMMKRAGEGQLSSEERQALDHMDDAPVPPTTDDDQTPADEPTLVDALRAKVLSIAHDLPHLALSLPTPRPFLPSIEQLASLRFPALSLPGAWVSAEGNGGHSTGDDVRTTEHGLMERHQEETAADAAMVAIAATADASMPHLHPISSHFTPSPPPFVLWGMTLEKSCELVFFLGWPFPFHCLSRGADRRTRKYHFWANVGEARWEVERQLDALRQRIAAGRDERRTHEHEEDKPAIATPATSLASGLMTRLQHRLAVARQTLRSRL